MLRHLHLRPLLTKARDAFERCGFIPYAYGSQLEQAGYIVADLERLWGVKR